MQKLVVKQLFGRPKNFKRRDTCYIAYHAPTLKEEQFFDKEDAWNWLEYMDYHEIPEDFDMSKYGKVGCRSFVRPTPMDEKGNIIFPLYESPTMTV